MTDYSKFILTEEEQLIFNKYKKTDEVYLSAEECRLLLRKKLVQPVLKGEVGWENGSVSGVRKLSQTGKELRSYQKQHTKELWLVNAKIPIIVSVITNLAVNGLLWLLPQIL